MSVLRAGALHACMRVLGEGYTFFNKTWSWDFYNVLP